MATLTDPGVAQLLDAPNHAVISTFNADGSVHAAVVWISHQDGELAINSAVGRKWPTNLDRDPRLTLVVYDQSNPYDYVEVRGTVQGTTDGADEHIDQLAKKYIGQDKYPLRQPGEQRIKYVISPQRIRHQKQR